MKRTIILTFFLLLGDLMIGQNVEAKITYNRKTDWIKIMSTLPWLSSEEVDRAKLTWGSDDDEDEGTNYELLLKDNKSSYTYKEEESAGEYSWKKADFLILRDYGKKKIKDNVEIAGKLFLIEDDFKKVKWKILNEIREIEGYLCMKAETENEIKGQKIIAWFTDQIRSDGGPEGYYGLPGLILELDINDGAAVITATDIDMKSGVDKIKVPKKMKGKKVDQEKYNKQIKSFIDDSIEGRKNPYWRIRY